MVSLPQPAEEEDQIYVDPGYRTIEGIVVVRLFRFEEPPSPGYRFVGSDYEEFTNVPYEVMSVDLEKRVAYVLPLIPIPGCPLPRL